MEKIIGFQMYYPWGSTSAIRNFCNEPSAETTLAEVWFGTHPSGPTTVATGETLAQTIIANPVQYLGEYVQKNFGTNLPFLVKLIAPSSPLSLQVHPTRRQAQRGYRMESLLAIATDSHQRNYKDTNHKPELLYALTTFEALSGFRAPRRAREIFQPLQSPLGAKIFALLDSNQGSRGIRKATKYLLHPDTRAENAAIAQLICECRTHLQQGTSPSVRAYTTACNLAEKYPGDPGAVLALLLNPVTLAPGETLFTPAGSLHVYLQGLAVEVMAASDNVIRVGLTNKHIDPREALRCLRFRAAPPVRIAAEKINSTTQVFYVPVDDFEVSLTRLLEPGVFVPVPGRGPRIIISLEGEIAVIAGGKQLDISRGQALFVSSGDGPLAARGPGELLQVDVP